MTHMTRNEGHLIVAAIRVLVHREGRPPEPQEVAELLDLPEASVRLQVAQLAELGSVILVESAYATHLEIADVLLLEDLPAEEAAAITSDLADFDRRKQAEAEKMARMFEDGEHDKRRAEKHDKMGKELFEFKQQKKPNPFGDD